MAGLENTAQNSQISALIDQWQVQYSRFINYSSVTCTRTHPSLSPVEKSRRSRGGNWISTSAATLKLAYRRSPTGGEAVITISPQSQVLGEHFVSKMLFSRPQVSCVSGYPERGCRSIFVSYKDGAGQVQKFAMPFSTLNDSDKFINFLKEIVKNESQQLLLTPIYNSGQPTHKEEHVMDFVMGLKSFGQIRGQILRMDPFANIGRSMPVVRAGSLLFSTTDCDIQSGGQQPLTTLSQQMPSKATEDTHVACASENCSHGTIIFVIYTHERIVIAADGRATSEWTHKEYGEFALLDSDENKKIKRIGSGFLLTAGGQKWRNDALWNLFDAQPYQIQCVLEAADIISQFISKDIEKGAEGFLVGFHPNEEDYVIFEFWDGTATKDGVSKEDVRMTMKKLKTDTFHSYGDGRFYADEIFKRLHVNMNRDEVLNCACEALLEISVRNVCCGGKLAVAEISRDDNLASFIKTPFLIDLLIELKPPTLLQEGLLMMAKTGYDILNYHNLHMHFKIEKDLEFRWPMCLGRVLPEWSCFWVSMVDLDNHVNVCEEYFHNHCQPHPKLPPEKYRFSRIGTVEPYLDLFVIRASFEGLEEVWKNIVDPE